MSFTYDVKEDILNENTEIDSLPFEILAFWKLVGKVEEGELVFNGSNLHVIRYFLKMSKKLYPEISWTIDDGHQIFNKQLTYKVKLKNAARLIDSLKLNLSLVEKETAHKVAYLRGAFLAKGSLSDPNKGSYHLEIVTDNQDEAVFLQRLCNSFNYNARISKRRSDLVVYLKEKDFIVEFLRRLGANIMMNKYEDILIKRQIVANTNRIINTEIANQQRTNNSASEQLKIIRYLEYNYPLADLDPKLLLVIKVRKENPESSLNELVKIINENYGSITKSGLNHRFMRLKEIAVDFEKRRK